MDHVFNSFGCMFRSGIAGYQVSLCLLISEITRLISKVAAPFHSSTGRVQSSDFPLSQSTRVTSDLVLVTLGV